MRRAAAGGSSVTVSAVVTGVPAANRLQHPIEGGADRPVQHPGPRPVGMHDAAWASAATPAGVTRELDLLVPGRQLGRDRWSPQPGDRTLHREHGRRRDRQFLASSAVQPTHASTVPSVAVGGHGDETEGLADAQLGRQERGHRPAASVGRCVAAQHPGRLADDAGERTGDVGAGLAPAGAGTRIASAGPGRERGSHHRVGRFGSDGDGHDLFAGAVAQGERDLDGGGVGLAESAPTRVPARPGDGDRDHDMRNTTPCPPSGYDQLIAPSVLHTR